MRNDACYESPYYRSFQQERTSPGSRPAWAPRVGRVIHTLVCLLLVAMLLVGLLLAGWEFPFGNVTQETLAEWFRDYSKGQNGVFMLVFTGVAGVLYGFARRQVSRAYARNGMLGVAMCLVKLVLGLAFLGVLVVWFIVRFMLELMAGDSRKEEGLYETMARLNDEAIAWDLSNGKTSGTL